MIFVFYFSRGVTFLNVGDDEWGGDVVRGVIVISLSLGESASTRGGPEEGAEAGGVSRPGPPEKRTPSLSPSVRPRPVRADERADPNSSALARSWFLRNLCLLSH